MEKKDRIAKFKTKVFERPKADITRVAHVPRAERRLQRIHFHKDIPENTPVDDSFAASVRFSDPILTVTTSSKDAAWRRDLLSNITTGLLLVSFISIFCMMIGDPMMIAFASPALIVFTALAMPESFDRVNIKYIACGVAAALLIAAVVILRSTIVPGFAYMMDEFYDVAEEAQAYIYDRIPGGDGASAWDCRIAMLCISSLLGLLMAVVPARLRRGAGILLTAAMMLALAYYGLLPETVCAAAMLIALLLTISKDNIFATLPLLLITVILFGAVTLIDPGESYGISRIDENIRDRIAFRSALIEREESTTEETFDSESLANQEAESDSSSTMADSASYIFTGFGLLVIAAIGAVAYLLIKRFRKRREAVRYGIDSADPREAVTAMFPYSVRWLKASGIESREAPFSEMADDIRRVYETGYAGRFSEMYQLWREAAYSDHDISEDDRLAMDRFTKDTVAMVSEKWNTMQRLRMIYKHAL